MNSAPPATAPILFHRVGRGALLTLAFVVGFALISMAIESAMRPAYVFGLTPKLRHLAEHRGKYEVAFIGSSRVFRHFIPREFDREMAAAGHPVRSFNFGIDGMGPPENFYVLRQLLTEHPDIRWVFIELWDVRTVAVDRLADTARFMHWHDPRHTALVIRRLLDDPRLDPWEKLSRTWVHLRAAFVRNSHIGRGSDALAPILNPRKKQEFREPTPWLESEGFIADESKPFGGEKRREYVEAAKQVRREFKTARLPEVTRQASAALARAVRASGVEPIFVVMPTVNAAENYVSPREQGIDADYLTLARPLEFPELYDVKLHRDDWHFTAAGAQQFTRRLAGEFRALLDARPVTSPTPAREK